MGIWREPDSVEEGRETAPLPFPPSARLPSADIPHRSFDRALIARTFARRSRHLALPLALALVLVALLGIVQPAAAQTLPPSSCPPGASPSFQLGFAALKAEVGEAMGQPIECERANPENGDTLQRTTTGLAFYRKSTNTPTFTDGYRHWALTPAGLVPWTGASVDPPMPAVAATSPDIVDAPPPAGAAGGCIGVGARTCLRTDPALGGAVAALQTTPVGTDLLRTAADANVSVRVGQVAPNAWAQYTPRTRIVLLSREISGFSAQGQAAVLAHELQHAADWAQIGSSVGTTQGCFDTEATAFRTQTAVWTAFYPRGLPRATNDLEQQLNNVSRSIQSNPDSFYRQLTQLYQRECAGH